VSLLLILLWATALETIIRTLNHLARTHAPKGPQ